MASFEKNFEIKKPFQEKPLEKIDQDIENEFYPERGEEQDYYSMLRRELKQKREGGTDIHFSDIDIDELSPKALELYRKYKRGKINSEEIKKFSAETATASSDYSFAAMLLNWQIDKAELERAKEKELLKKEAKQKLIDLKNVKPHIVAYVDNINLDLLKRLDLKAIKDLDEQSFISYEKNLREYFKNKTEGKKEIKKEVEEDPRYQWYCMLREILDLGPSRPDIFIN